MSGLKMMRRAVWISATATCVFTVVIALELIGVISSQQVALGNLVGWFILVTAILMVVKGWKQCQS